MRYLTDAFAAEVRVLEIDVFDILVVQTTPLALLAGPDVHAGDPVDDEQQNARDDKGPSSTGGRTGKLQTKLAVVSVPPAAVIRRSGHAVERNHPLVGEQARQ